MGCGNRLPISGECMLGCGGFGGCRHGHEDHIQPRSANFNWLTGKMIEHDKETPRSLIAQPDGAQ